MSRAGILRVMAELAGADFHLPEGSRVIGRYDEDDTPFGCVSFVVEGDWLPDTVGKPNLPDIEATYTTDYARGVCRGRFTCGETTADGPEFQLAVGEQPEKEKE